MTGGTTGVVTTGGTGGGVTGAGGTAGGVGGTTGTVGTGTVVTGVVTVTVGRLTPPREGEARPATTPLVQTINPSPSEVNLRIRIYVQRDSLRDEPGGWSSPA